MLLADREEHGSCTAHLQSKACRGPVEASTDIVNNLIVRLSCLQRIADICHGLDLLYSSIVLGPDVEGTVGQTTSSAFP